MDVSVVASGRDVADARLHRLVGALVEAGMSVEVLGLGAAADAPAGLERVRTRPRGGRAGRALNSLRLPLSARGRVVVALDPDAVPAAWLAARASGRSLVVDLSEDYGALLRDRSWARGPAGAAARAVAATAESLAARADLLVVADEHVPPLHARRRLVVRNLPTSDYLPAPTRPDPVPRAVYVGDLRRSRGLFDMVEAVAAAPGWLLDLVGPVAAADQAELDARLADPRVAGRVRLHGRRPPREAWAVASGAWAGLCLLHDTPAFRAAMPSKVYEYLSAGLPAVVSPLPRQAELVASTGAGVVADGAEQVAAALLGYVADLAVLDAHRQAAAHAAARFDGPRVHREFAASVADLLRAR